MLVLTVQSVMPWMALLPTKVISEKERCYASCTRASSILSPRGKRFLHPIWSPSQTSKPPMTIHCSRRNIRSCRCSCHSLQHRGGGSHCQLFPLIGLFADVHSRGSKRTITVARMLEVGVFLFKPPITLGIRGTPFWGCEGEGNTGPGYRGNVAEQQNRSHHAKELLIYLGFEADRGR